MFEIITNYISKFNAIATALAAVLGLPALYGIVVPSTAVSVHVFDREEISVANTGNRTIILNNVVNVEGLDDDGNQVSMREGTIFLRSGATSQNSEDFVLLPKEIMLYEFGRFPPPGSIPTRDCMLVYEWTVANEDWRQDRVDFPCLTN